MNKVQLILGASLLMISSISSASVIMFTDRAEWEIAATSLGLTIETEHFANAPNLIPQTPINYYDPTGSFSLAGTTWSIQGGTYNSVDENLVRTGDFDIGLGLEDIFSNTSLFGFGFYNIEPVAKMEIIDSNGVFSSSRFCCTGAGSIVGFVGILSTHSILPNNDIYREVSIDALPANISGLDNFSVAVSPVPVPAGIWLFGTALIGLVGFSKRRLRSQL